MHILSHVPFLCIPSDAEYAGKAPIWVSTGPSGHATFFGFATELPTMRYAQRLRSRAARLPAPRFVYAANYQRIRRLSQPSLSFGYT